MPTEKRARKRAQREAKMAALERQRKRRATIRRTVTLVVIVGIAIGIALLVSSGKKKAAAPPAPAADSQVALDAAAVKAGCPSSPTKALKKPTWSAAPSMTIDTSKTYTATVKTDIGTFTIALDPKDAPMTVNNFVFLTNHDYYNCEAFPRVIPQFMDQTGSASQTTAGSPGYEFANENSSPTGGYVAGDVAMANSGPNTNGSEFFIVVAPYNNTGYSLFGKVTSGMSVVTKINDDGSASGTPKVTHRMLMVTISTS